MPDAALDVEYERARNEYTKAVEVLVPLLIRMALDSIADVLPGAHRLDLDGRINEDWITVLRIQRVLDDEGRVLFDVEFGHDDRVVEDMIDEVGSKYLDLLLNLTGDDWMGAKSIDGDDVRL